MISSECAKHETAALANSIDTQDDSARRGEETRETSPLLANRSRDVESDNSSLSDTSNDHEQALEPPLSTVRLILLCLGMIGLQLAWAAELSNGSPFLLSLGMSKSLLAIVWIAGPLAGVLVQPIVGIWSDSCQISWGRRRPFLLAGAVVTAVSLMCLSWTQDIVQGLARSLGRGPDSRFAILGAQAFAVFWIYVLDFGVNVLQAALRAFIVDVAPSFQQDVANAWASRLNSIANIGGYLLSYAPLPEIFPWLGDTQLKVLCGIGTIALIATVSISCLATPEEDPRISWPSTTSTTRKIAGFLKTSFTAFSRLPTQTRRVCFAQLFNWIGWFPFLFYISTYIGQLYVNPIFEKHPNATKAEIDKAWEEGTRLGAFALLTFAVTAFIGNSILPFFMQRLEAPQTNQSRVDRILSLFRIPGLTIQRAWMISHLFFALCMWSTLFITTPKAGAIMTACVGFCWAMTNWAPFAIIAADISSRNHHRGRRKPSSDNEDDSTHGNSTSDESTSEAAQHIDQAGVVLGMHNVAVSAPQIVATLIASAIFHYSQKGRGVANDDSIAHALRFGGVTAIVAAWATSRIA